MLIPCILIFMTSHIISAPPSRGKSYIATWLAVNSLKEGKKVFSNYPIIYTVPLTFKQKLTNLYRWIRKQPRIENKKLSTYKWDDKYIDAGLHDCIIILDEAYKVVNCHDRLTDTQHDFFATTGHNNIDVYIIAQNYARINLVIREMAIFWIIRKFSNPLSLVSKTGRKELTPLIFFIDVYLSEKDYNFKTMNPKALFETKRVFFDKAIAESYNTQYYRKKEKPILVITWLEDMKNTSTPIPNPEETKMMNEFINS